MSYTHSSTKEVCAKENPPEYAQNAVKYEKHEKKKKSTPRTDPVGEYAKHAPCIAWLMQASLIITRAKEPPARSSRGIAMSSKPTAKAVVAVDPSSRRPLDADADCTPAPTAFARTTWTRNRKYMCMGGGGDGEMHLLKNQLLFFPSPWHQSVYLI